jgi:hypothetical protein
LLARDFRLREAGAHFSGGSLTCYLPCALQCLQPRGALGRVVECQRQRHCGNLPPVRSRLVLPCMCVKRAEQSNPEILIHSPSSHGCPCRWSHGHAGKQWQSTLSAVWTQHQVPVPELSLPPLPLPHCAFVPPRLCHSNNYPTYLSQCLKVSSLQLFSICVSRSLSSSPSVHLPLPLLPSLPLPPNLHRRSRPPRLASRTLCKLDLCRERETLLDRNLNSQNIYGRP